MAEVKIEQLKPNSHKYREEQQSKDLPAEIHRTNKVIEGEAIVKKRSLWRKFTEAFFGGDLHTAGEYVAYDVMLPAIKRTVSDMFANGIEMLLFGASKDRTRRDRNGGNERVSYASYYKSDVRDYRRNDSSNNHSGYDYRDIILASRGAAEEVIDVLTGIIDEYGQASVADLYDAVGITGNFTDNKYGWLDMKGAAVRLVRDGYLLDLPKAIPLD